MSNDNDESNKLRHSLSLHKVSINYDITEKTPVLDEFQIEQLIDAKCKDSGNTKTMLQIELMKDFIFKYSYNK